MTKHILIVEPDPVLAALLATALGDIGFASTSKLPAHLDPSVFSGEAFDCVLLDTVYDGASWTAAAIDLGLLADRNNVAVVIIPDEHVDPKLIEEHGWQRLDKPFAVTGMEAAIGAALSRRLLSPE